MKTLLAALTLLLPLAACGGSQPRGTAQDGGTDALGDAAARATGEFVSDGVPGWPDDADEIRLVLGEAEIRFSAGCNQFGGPATWELPGEGFHVQGAFDAGSFAGTERGCDPGPMRRDEWMVDFFDRADTLVLDGTDVALRAGRTEVWFVPTDEVDGQEPAAVPLEGTDWRLDGVGERDGDAASVTVVPAGVVARLRIVDGRLELSTGCNTGSADAAVHGDTVRVAGLVLSRAGCAGAAAEIEQGVLAVLRDGDLSWRVSGTSLRLETPDGSRQLTYHAEE